MLRSARVRTRRYSGYDATALDAAALFLYIPYVAAHMRYASVVNYMLNNADTAMPLTCREPCVTQILFASTASVSSCGSTMACRQHLLRLRRELIGAAATLASLLSGQQNHECAHAALTHRVPSARPATAACASSSVISHPHANI
eukprot:IDg8095t1